MKNCGIYKIENLKNGDIYIGQSMRIKQRFSSHLYSLKKGNHKNRYLQNAYNKYGVENFKFSILLYCEPFELTRYEQWFVDNLNPEYNLAKECVDSPKGIKRSDDFKIRVGIASKGRNKGRIHSEESKKKMSNAYKKRDHKKYDRGISWVAILKKNNVIIDFYDTEIEYIKNFNNIEKEKFLFSYLLYLKMIDIASNLTGRNIKISLKKVCNKSHIKYNQEILGLIDNFEIPKNSDNIVMRITIDDKYKSYTGPALYTNLVGIICKTCNNRIFIKSNRSAYCKECLKEKNRARIYGWRHSKDNLPIIYRKNSALV